MRRKLLQVLVILGLLASIFSFSTVAGGHPNKAKGGSVSWDCPYFPCI
jgi:hypothetical protein